MPSQGRELTDHLIQLYRNYYRDDIGQLAHDYPETRSLNIDFQDIQAFDHDLAHDFLNQYDQMRQLAEEALQLYDDLPTDTRLGKANVRIYNLPLTTSLSNIRTSHIGNLISVVGTVRSASQVWSHLTEAAFECQRCGTMSYIPQRTGDYEEPHECQGCERQGPFRIDTDQSMFIDRQRIVIEQRATGVGSSADVSSIVGFIEDDVAGDVETGDTVTVTGKLRKVTDERFETTVFDKRLDISSIVTTHPLDVVANIGDMRISDANKQQFVELSNRESLYENIVESIAPAVYGYEQGKLALALQLFSGVEKNLPDGTNLRGDINVLLVGDPGTAKSVLLRRAAALAPRAVHTSGKDTTEVGLTAAATPSSGNADPWEIKGGVLAMASGGLACIDNFDKLRSEVHDALHGVLEDQQLNVSKASVSKTIPAKTSVLGAANPKYGRFDQYEPIGEQVNLPPGLISQFDLLFTITDRPDPEIDEEMANHVLDSHTTGEMDAQRQRQASPKVSKVDVEERLAEADAPIDRDLLRRYIIYTRQHCYPTMTENAKEAIKSFYVEIRSKGADEGTPVPVSARKLESLVRLAEASARMRLSDFVTEDDAERVTHLIRKSLRDIGMDPETGGFDADAVKTKNTQATKQVAETPQSSEEMVENFKQLIQNIEEEHEEGAPISEVIAGAAKIGLSEEVVEQTLEKLRRKGEIYEPKKDILRTT